MQKRKEDNVDNETVAATFADHENRLKVSEHRIADLEETYKQIQELTISVKELTMSVKKHLPVKSALVTLFIKRR